MIKSLKQLFCKHRWKYLWFESYVKIRYGHQHYTTQVFKCIKCGKKKEVTFKK